MWKALGAASLLLLFAQALRPRGDGAFVVRVAPEHRLPVAGAAVSVPLRLSNRTSSLALIPLQPDPHPVLIEHEIAGRWFGRSRVPLACEGWAHRGTSARGEAVLNPRETCVLTLALSQPGRYRVRVPSRAGSRGRVRVSDSRAFTIHPPAATPGDRE